MLNFSFNHEPIMSPFVEISPGLCRFNYLISSEKEKKILAAFLIERNGRRYTLNLELECSGNFSC